MHKGHTVQILTRLPTMLQMDGSDSAKVTALIVNTLLFATLSAIVALCYTFCNASSLQAHCRNIVVSTLPLWVSSLLQKAVLTGMGDVSANEHDGLAANVRHGLLLAARQPDIYAAQLGIDLHGQAAGDDRQVLNVQKA